MTLFTNMLPLWYSIESVKEKRHRVYSLLRKHLRSKKSPCGIKYSRWWGYHRVAHFLKAGVDFSGFSIGVRVGTEANQLTVNKWSHNFYRAGEKNQNASEVHFLLPTHRDSIYSPVHYTYLYHHTRITKSYLKTNHNVTHFTIKS